MRDCRVSMTALAAEAAEERPRALMIAAPRCWTVGKNVPRIQESSLMASEAVLPSIRAL